MLVNFSWQLVRFTLAVTSLHPAGAAVLVVICTQSASPSPFAQSDHPRLPPVAPCTNVTLVTDAKAEVTMYEPPFFSACSVPPTSSLSNLFQSMPMSSGLGATFVLYTVKDSCSRLYLVVTVLATVSLGDASRLCHSVKSVE